MREVHVIENISGSNSKRQAIALTIVLGSVPGRTGRTSPGAKGKYLTHPHVQGEIRSTLTKAGWNDRLARHRVGVKSPKPGENNTWPCHISRKSRPVVKNGIAVQVFSSGDVEWMT